MSDRERDGQIEEKPVIHDRRRIDPVTGEARQKAGKADAAASQPGVAPAAEAAATGEGEGDEVARLRAQLEERTSDLQRIQAEYANYRKRVDRDRAVVRDVAVASVLTELLPVVDDVGRAREHGELEGGFKSVGESLESILGKFGLQQFGQRGEPFDPAIHEALVHSYSGEVSEATCVEIFQPGYRLGERVIRPARVAVAEPEETPAPAPAPEAPAAGGDTPAAEATGGRAENDDGERDAG